MIEPTTCEPQARMDVGVFEIRSLDQYLRARESTGQQIEHITYPNAHAAYARTASASIWVRRDAIHQFH
jgi:hypothetical protein